MKKRLEEIKKRLDNATQNEWVAYYEEYNNRGNVTYDDGLSLFEANIGGYTDAYKEDVAFIAHSKEDIRFLLDLVKELEDKLKQV